MALHDWLPIQRVTRHIGLPDDAPVPVGVDEKRRAAAAVVERARKDLFGVDEVGAQTFAGDDAVVEGAALYAARLYARRETPAGLASYGEFGPAPVLRLDPDVERLLGLGRYAKPALG